MQVCGFCIPPEASPSKTTVQMCFFGFNLFLYYVSVSSVFITSARIATVDYILRFPKTYLHLAFSIKKLWMGIAESQLSQEINSEAKLSGLDGVIGTYSTQLSAPGVLVGSLVVQMNQRASDEARASLVGYSFL